MGADIHNVAITTIKGVNYRCVIHGVSKFHATYLLENSMRDGLGFI